MPSAQWAPNRVASCHPLKDGSLVGGWGKKVLVVSEVLSCAAWVAICLVTWRRVAWLRCWPRSLMPGGLQRSARLLIKFFTWLLFLYIEVQPDFQSHCFDPGRLLRAFWVKKSGLVRNCTCWRRRSGRWVPAPGCTWQTPPQTSCIRHEEDGGDPVGSADTDPAGASAPQARPPHLLPLWALWEPHLTTRLEFAFLFLNTQRNYPLTLSKSPGAGLSRRNKT